MERALAAAAPLVGAERPPLDKAAAPIRSPRLSVSRRAPLKLDRAAVATAASPATTPLFRRRRRARRRRQETSRSNSSTASQQRLRSRVG